LPKIAELLEAAEEDLLAFYQLPGGAPVVAQRYHATRWPKSAAVFVGIRWSCFP
jgi:hypothetical protein